MTIILRPRWRRVARYTVATMALATLALGSTIALSVPAQAADGKTQARPFAAPENSFSFVGSKAGTTLPTPPSPEPGSSQTAMPTAPQPAPQPEADDKPAKPPAVVPKPAAPKPAAPAPAAPAPAVPVSAAPTAAVRASEAVTPSAEGQVVPLASESPWPTYVSTEKPQEFEPAVASAEASQAVMKESSAELSLSSETSGGPKLLMWVGLFLGLTLLAGGGVGIYALVHVRGQHRGR
ncbi:MAG: hypothetical protein WBX27_05445 [Specibacter sp.]